MSRRTTPVRRRSRASHTIQPGFTIGSLTNLFAIPIVTGVIVMSGFYYVTNDKLGRYGADISRINDKIEISNKSVLDKTAEDAAARAKIRDEFISAQMKTADGIGKLDTRLAVAEANQKIANEQLTKISDSLQKIVAFPPPRNR